MKKSISATTCKRCGNPNATIGFDHCELCETGAEKKQREKKKREQFAKIIPGVQGGNKGCLVVILLIIIITTSAFIN